MKNTIFIILGIMALVLLFNKYQADNSWTLMVCGSKMGNGIDCQDNLYEIPEFKSRKECMLEGATRFSKQGFECGRDCKNENGIINVCQEVCNAGGCSD